MGGGREARERRRQEEKSMCELYIKGGGRMTHVDERWRRKSARTSEKERERMKRERERHQESKRRRRECGCSEGGKK